MRILIAFASLSGNTRDLARLIRSACLVRGHEVAWLEAGLDRQWPDSKQDHDLYLLGSWSDNGGRTPLEMKQLIAALVEAVGKPRHVAAFGTGETQWGAEYYCGAVRRIAAFFATALPRLEVEQMPHGQRDAAAIEHWLDQIFMTFESADHANPARHHA